MDYFNNGTPAFITFINNQPVLYSNPQPKQPIQNGLQRTYLVPFIMLNEIRPVINYTNKSKLNGVG